MKPITCIEYFCADVLPNAKHSAQWTEDSIRKGFSWAKLCQKAYQTYICSKELKKINLDKNLNSKTGVKNFKLSERTDSSSMLIDPGNFEELFPITVNTIPSKRKLTILSKLVSNYDCTISDIENSIHTLFLSLFLNGHLNEVLKDFIRKLATDFLSDDSLKNLWLVVDQIKLNSENIHGHLEDYQKNVPGHLLTTSSHVEIIKGEVKSSLIAAFQCNKLDIWFLNQIKLDTLATSFDKNPVFLSYLLNVCSELQCHEIYDDAVEKILHIITTVLTDDHESFNYLIVQLLNIKRNFISGQSLCMCVIISKILVSFLKTLFLVTSKNSINTDNIKLKLNDEVAYHLSVDRISQLLHNILICNFNCEDILMLDYNQLEKVKHAHCYINDTVRLILSQFMESKHPWFWHNIFIKCFLQS